MNQLYLQIYIKMISVLNFIVSNTVASNISTLLQNTSTVANFYLIYFLFFFYKNTKIVTFVYLTPTTLGNTNPLLYLLSKWEKYSMFFDFKKSTSQ